MYKTAVISDEISQDLKTACQLAKAYHLDGLEIRSVNEVNPFMMSEKDAKEIKAICDDNGLLICGVASPFFKCHIDNPQEIVEHYEGLKRCATNAHIFGTDLIRGFTFWKNPTLTVSLPQIAANFDKAIQIAEEGDIRIAIESEPSVNTGNMRMLYDFLQLLSSKRVGALYDAGNEVTDPLAPDPYPVGYELLKPYIFHVHVKDMRRSKASCEEFSRAMLGEGDVDYDGLFKRLKSDNYNRWVSVETHYRILDTGLSFEDLARPQGSSFSAGGYPATEAYFKVLKDRYHWQEQE